MIVEHATGVVHRRVGYDADPRLALTACEKRVHTRPMVPIVMCPCPYHKPQVAPTLPSNQVPCVGCFQDGVGFRPVRVLYAPPRR